MSNNQQPWFIGKNAMVKICGLIPTVQVDNTIQYVADSTIGTVTFAGLLDEHDEDVQFQDEDISPTDCFYDNPVPIQQGMAITIHEIATKTQLLASGSVVGNKLRQILLQTYYVKILIEEFNDANPSRNSSTGFLQRAILYAKFTGLPRNVPKGKTVWAGAFKSVAVSDGSGGYKANPYFTTTYGTTDIP